MAGEALTSSSTRQGSASDASADSAFSLSIDNRELGASALMIAAFAALAWVGHLPPVNGLAFAAGLATAWIGYALFFAHAKLTPAVLWVGIATAIAARASGLLSSPIYEDDWARYLWDGHRFLQDGTPYGLAPSAYLEDTGLDTTWVSILGQVNNPDVPTIYAPTLQYVFAFVSWLAPTSLAALKCLLIAFDLALWAIVWRLGGARAGLGYALCPLVIFEVSFNAHADIIGAALTVACFWLVRKGRDIAGGVVFALALACKPFAVIVAPALLNRRWPLIGLAIAAVLALVYVPFVLKGATELAGLEVFSRWWEFNSLGFGVAKALVGDAIARPVCLVLGIATSASLMLYWRLREADTFPPADHWLIALLFFAPVINPWYLLWAVPWACLRPTALTWSILPAVSVSYLTAGVLGVEGPGSFDHPSWVRPFEVLLAIAVYLALRAQPWVCLPRAPWNAATGRQTEQREV
jgi:alpha-1,6-mannosyltransferase